LEAQEVAVDYFGIDVGGSGIKGAPVCLDGERAGELTAPRFRVVTPQPAKPQPMAEAVAEVVRSFNWTGPIGVGFPSAIRNGVASLAANIHKKWIGTNAAELFAQTTGCPVCVANDADVAGLAEMTFGAGRGRKGVVMVITIGTGLGSALFTDGHLVMNTELGHIEINGADAETNASDAARKRDELSWKNWGARFNDYLNRLELLFWPDLFILGGGGSKNYDKFAPYLKVQAEVEPALLLNDAGIVGAALAARACLERSWSVPLFYPGPAESENPSAEETSS
jgi:polyphosphate glucokinase